MSEADQQTEPFDDSFRRILDIFRDRITRLHLIDRIGELTSERIIDISAPHNETTPLTPPLTAD